MSLSDSEFEYYYSSYWYLIRDLGFDPDDENLRTLIRQVIYDHYTPEYDE
jgi:hypothetical protein